MLAEGSRSVAAALVGSSGARIFSSGALVGSSRARIFSSGALIVDWGALVLSSGALAVTRGALAVSSGALVVSSGAGCSRASVRAHGRQDCACSGKATCRRQSARARAGEV